MWGGGGGGQESELVAESKLGLRAKMPTIGQRQARHPKQSRSYAPWVAAGLLAMYVVDSNDPSAARGLILTSKKSHLQKDSGLASMSCQMVVPVPSLQ